MKLKEFMFRCQQLGLFVDESIFSVTVAYSAPVRCGKIAYASVDIDISKILSEGEEFPAEVYLKVKRMFHEFLAVQDEY